MNLSSQFLKPRRSLAALLGFFYAINLFAASPQVGTLAPQFSLTDRLGQKLGLEDFKGSVVILNFWATWCPPCVDELPSLEYLNQYFKAKPLTLMAVSVDKGWSDIDTFFQSIGSRPTFLILLDSERSVATKLYGTEKFPESYIIDQEGIIRKKIIGATNWADPKILGELEGILKSSQPKNQAKKTKHQ